MAENHIVFFDGDCAMCNKWVQFVLKHDRKQKFKFAKLQSGLAERVVKQSGVPGLRTDFSTLLYWRNGKILKQSKAVIMILGDLGKRWKTALILLVIPAFFRDMLYGFISKHRHRFMQADDSCVLLSEEQRDRILY